MMVLSIELSPEVECRLRQQAEAKGYALPDYARLLIEKETSETQEPVGPKSLTADAARLGKRAAGLHEGTIWMSEDFIEPLPDSFWLDE